MYVFTGAFGFDSFHLLLLSCSYYELDDVNHETVNRYLSTLVERSLRDLGCSYCIEIQEVCFIIFFLKPVFDLKKIFYFTPAVSLGCFRTTAPLSRSRTAESPPIII